MEVTHDYPDAWHSMDLVAEHRLRMLHTSGAYEKWQAVQKTQPHPSSKLSIKIEQVLEVSLSCMCNCLHAPLRALVPIFGQHHQQVQQADFPSKPSACVYSMQKVTNLQLQVATKLFSKTEQVSEVSLSMCVHDV